MKIVKFDLAECPDGNAKLFLRKILIETKAAGFLMPDIERIFWDTMNISRDDIFDAVANILNELWERRRLNYVLKVYETKAMIVDEDPKNVKKEKALRRLKRKAWKLDEA